MAMEHHEIKEEARQSFSVAVREAVYYKSVLATQPSHVTRKIRTQTQLTVQKGSRW